MPSIADITGQPRACESLQRALRTEKLHHALIFAGPSGVGKGSTAIALAGALNCMRKPQVGCPKPALSTDAVNADDSEALGAPGTTSECRSCRLLRRGQHPDFIDVEPSGAFIRIDQIRDLQRRLTIASHEGGYRVVRIEAAEKLHPSAANALLKSIEEPPSRTLFVLITDAPRRLLPTIISRCAPVHFGRLSDKDVAAVLDRSGRLDDTNETLKIAMNCAQGSPGRALQASSDETWAQAMLHGQALREAGRAPADWERLQTASAIGTDRTLARRALEWLGTELHKELRSSPTPNIVEDLSAVVDALSQIERNISLPMVFETMLLRFHSHRSIDLRDGRSILRSRG